VSEAVRVANLLSLGSDNDYSKYENVRLSAQNKMPPEGARPRPKKILVSPVHAKPPQHLAIQNGKHLPTQSSCQKASGQDKGKYLDTRRCKSETKEIKSTFRHVDIDLDGEGPVKKSVPLHARLSSLKEQIFQRQTPVFEKSSDLIRKRKEESDTIVTKSQQKEKPRILVRRESPLLKSKEKKLPEEPQNDEDSNTKEKHRTGKRGVSPSLRTQEDPKHQRRQSPLFDRIAEQKAKHHELSDQKSIQRTTRNENHVSPDQKPLMDVKRRLDFDKAELGERGDSKDLHQELDFTDKIAALRSLINRDRESKDISDRRAYYNEYKTSSRKVIVARTDSLKENENIDLEELENQNFNAIPGTRHHSSRRAQSADVFRRDIRDIDGRLTAVELQLLRERLEEKHEKERQTNVKGTDSDSGKTNQGASESIQGTDRDLIHVRQGRKVLSSSKKSPHKVETDSDTKNTKFKMEDVTEKNVRPSSRQGSREVQTNVLNSSTHSVQSNVPYYESLGRPGSAPLFNCEIAIGKRNTYRNIDVPYEDFEKSLNGEGKDVDVDIDGRKNSVGKFVGSSAEEKGKHRLRSSSRIQNVHALKSENEKFKKVLDNDVLKSDTGNHRPSSRNSNVGEDGEVQAINGQVGRVGTPKQRRRSASTVNGLDTDKIHPDKEMSKSARKVKEWIRKQEMLNKGRPASAFEDFPSGRVLMEELNVSISIPADQNMEMKHSPADSCDRVPVKLEKKKNERTHTIGQPTNAYGFLFNKDGSSGTLSNRQAIFDRLERITMAVTTQQHQFEVEIPVSEVKRRITPASEVKCRSTPVSEVKRRSLPSRPSSERPTTGSSRLAARENSDSADTE